MDLYGGSLLEFLGSEEPSEDDTEDWIIRGLVARAQPGALGGDPKTGKTMMAEDWSIALAAGEPSWCGFEIPKRCRVLLMPREDAVRTTKIRLYQIARGHGYDPKNLDGWLEVDALNSLDFANAAHVAKLKRTAEKFDVIFIDSLSTIHSGDENGSKDAGLIGNVWREVSLESETAVVLIHHFNGKGASNDTRSVGHRLRGSSKFFAACRHIVGLKRHSKGVVKIETDGNLFYQPEPFAVELVRKTEADGRVGLSYRNLGTPHESVEVKVRDAVLAVLSFDRGASKRAVRTEVRVQLGKCSNGRTDKALESLQADGRITESSSKGGWVKLPVPPNLPSDDVSPRSDVDAEGKCAAVPPLKGAGHAAQPQTDSLAQSGTNGTRTTTPRI